jgi:hypothetical protein
MDAELMRPLVKDDNDNDDDVSLKSVINLTRRKK